MEQKKQVGCASVMYWPSSQLLVECLNSMTGKFICKLRTEAEAEWEESQGVMIYSWKVILLGEETMSVLGSAWIFVVSLTR